MTTDTPDAPPPAPPEAEASEFTADVILNALDECTRRWGNAVGVTTFLTWLGMVRIAQDKGPEFAVKISRIAGATKALRYRATSDAIRRLAKSGMIRLKRGRSFKSKADKGKRRPWHNYTVAPELIPDPNDGF